MRSPRPAVLGVCAAAVLAAGFTAAATGDAPAAVAPLAVVPAAAPAHAPAPAATAVPVPAPPREVDKWVRTDLANVWERPRKVRGIDRPSLGAHPDFAGWVRRQSYLQRLALGSRLMTQVVRGEHVVVFGSRGPWDHVRVVEQRGGYYRDGILGWVDRTQLSTTRIQVAAPRALPRQGSSLVTAARAYLGTTYIFGGMTRHGIDCSGLTYDAALRVGVVLPRDAADQSRVGHGVRRRDLRPGDLVFFGSGSWTNIHHVGIYVGGGRMLHAPHTGSSVRISPLSAFSDYFGARRLVAAR